MSKAQVFHDMTDAELREKYASLKNELFNLRFQHATGQLKNPVMLRTVKKDIARCLTILKEREQNPELYKARTAKVKATVTKAKVVKTDAGTSKKAEPVVKGSDGKAKAVKGKELVNAKTANGGKK